MDQIEVIVKKLDDLIELVKESNNRARTTRIVEAIIDDIRDRQGLGDEWEAIDGQTQNEIRDKWTAIVTD
jgi:hypothetical protein